MLVICSTNTLPLQQCYIQLRTICIGITQWNNLLLRFQTAHMELMKTAYVALICGPRLASIQHSGNDNNLTDCHFCT